MTTLMSVPAPRPSAYQPDLSPVADSVTLAAMNALLPGEVAGIEPTPLVATNTSGGVVGTGAAFALVGLQPTVLAWMLP